MTDSAATTEDFVVELRLAPAARSVRPARSVAASVGVDAGMDVDELDDLRVAVQEAIAILLVSTTEPIDMRVTGRTDDVLVEFETATDAELPGPSHVARQLLEVLVAEHHAEKSGGVARVTMRSHPAGA